MKTEPEQPKKSLDESSEQPRTSDPVEIIRNETPKTNTATAATSSWLTFWRRPSKRDQQLATLQDGYSEMLELMRTIRQHISLQSANQQELYSHIPTAIDGLEKFGRHAEQQTQLLNVINQQFEKNSRRDEQLSHSMERVSDTLSQMDKNNRETALIIQEFAERTQVAEDLVRNVLLRSQRRLVFMVVLLLLTTLFVTGTALYMLH